MMQQAKDELPGTGGGKRSSLSVLATWSEVSEISLRAQLLNVRSSIEVLRKHFLTELSLDDENLISINRELEQIVSLSNGKPLSKLEGHVNIIKKLGEVAEEAALDLVELQRGSTKVRRRSALKSTRELLEVINEIV